MSNFNKNNSDLKTKTVIGFLQLIVMLSLFLFVPAWSLDFWQAWVYLAIFIGSTVIITIYLWEKDPRLLESRVEAGPTAEKEKSQKIIQAVASICFLLILVIPGLDHHFGWSNVSLYVVILGDILVFSGFLFIFLVFRENTYAAAIIEVSAEQKVITTGPYSIVRHPMYLGDLVMLFGTPLALGSWWGLLVFGPFILVIALRLLDEEKFLYENLPGYKEFCQKTHYRLFPLLW